MDSKALIERVASFAALDQRKAEGVSKALVGALCGRISQGEVEDLNAEAHDIIQRMCTFQRKERPERYDFEQVLREVMDRFQLDETTAEKAMLAAFGALKESIPAEEARDVADQLPEKLKIVWLEA